MRLVLLLVAVVATVSVWRWRRRDEVWHVAADHQPS